ncbi:MAG: hypothetical protein IMX02_01100 [Limnochordaceae bacterium]|nr:hypothetical protein [Limnochordaceae bacterium]
MLLAVACALLASAAQESRAALGGGREQADLSTQGIVTLLARRQAWIWKVPPGSLRVEEVHSPDGSARLVWVSGAPKEPDQPVQRHAFAVMSRDPKGERDLFTDLTPVVDTGYPAYTLALIPLGPGEPSAFAIGAPSGAGKRMAALYVVVPGRTGASGGPPVLSIQADIITVDTDAQGYARIQAGTFDFGTEETSVLRVPESATLDPLGRPARAVTVTVYRWDRARSAFEAQPRAPELTPFGVAEAFVAAVGRGDMRYAFSLTTAEWRRVMGVQSEAQLRSYLQSTRPYLLMESGPYLFLGGSVGREAASILFSDRSGRIYRIRLRYMRQDESELLVLPGAAGPELKGPWQIDGLDGGS